MRTISRHSTAGNYRIEGEYFTPGLTCTVYVPLSIPNFDVLAFIWFLENIIIRLTTISPEKSLVVGLIGLKTMPERIRN